MDSYSKNFSVANRLPHQVMKTFTVLIAVICMIGIGLCRVEAQRMTTKLDPVSNLPRIHPQQKDSEERKWAPSITTLAVDTKGVVYAGSFGMGLFASQDQGQSWKPLNEGLVDPFVLCLTVTPQQEVLAGTVRSGVYRLTSGSRRWEPLSKGLKLAEVKSFLVDEQEVYAGTGMGVFRLNRSTEAWEKVGQGLEQVLVPGLAMLDDGTLLAATSGKGLYLFDTQQAEGAHWVDSRSVFIDPKERLPHRYLRVIAVNQAQHLFLGTQNGGVFRSLDGGKSWTPLSRRLPNDSIRGIVPVNDDILVATGRGIFRWEEKRQRWIARNSGLTKLSIQSLTLTGSGDLYVGTSSGAFRSRDEGGHWDDVSQGFGVQLVPKGPYD